MIPLVHFEIHAEDPEKVAAFYRAVFGWGIKKWVTPDTDMSYWLLTTAPPKTPNAINGGLTKRIGPRPKEGQPMNGYVCIMSVDNVDNYVRKVEGAGGKVVVPRMDVPEVGSLVYCADPDGNLFGMIKPIMPVKKKSKKKIVSRK
ncbi:MAG: VOC family protein [Nanoarchaeota archaeon]|nr:VOC family protein [Nanoarchaeota archaeon]